MREIRVHFCDFNTLELAKAKILGILERHFCVILDEKNPDFLFFSVFGKAHAKYECVRIFYSGEYFVPNFNICDYAIGYDYISFDDRYCRYPIYLLFNETYEKALKKHENITPQTLLKKPNFCNFIVSNAAHADPFREQAFFALSKYKKIDSGGRYLNNIGGPVADKFAFQSTYRFSLAFENASAPGYLTEKIFDAAGAATIPIYWGDAKAGLPLNIAPGDSAHANKTATPPSPQNSAKNPATKNSEIFAPNSQNFTINKTQNGENFSQNSATATPNFAPHLTQGGGLNPMAFINAHDFESFDALISHIKAVEADENLQLKYLTAPLFRDPNHREILESNLEAFLVNIFSQTPQKARRRRAYLYVNYEQKIYKTTAKFIETALPFWRFLRKIGLRNKAKK